MVSKTTGNVLSDAEPDSEGPSETEVFNEFSLSKTLDNDYL